MERNESFAAAELKEMHVRLAWAQLEVYADDIENVQVIASGDEHTVSELRINVEDGLLLIEQPQYGISLDITHGHWMELCVRVPKTWDHPLRLNTISGLLRAKGLGSETIAIETIAGDLKASQLTAGELALKTTSGTLHGKQLITEKLTIRTVSGNVQLQDVSAKTYRITSVSGDITMEPGTGFEQMDIRTVSGDFAILTELDALHVTVRTVSGKKILDGVRQTDDETAPSVRFMGISGDLKITGKRTA
ncbi:MAG: DUF4097 family beta strand repeat protein [Clostridiales bacterium]|nr:DUF4097 family beta strand repeat protein [Clostridiales bacterium]